MKIKIPYEMVEKLLKKELKSSIKILQNQINNLSERDNLNLYEQEDLKNFQEDLMALKKTYLYFTGDEYE